VIALVLVTHNSAEFLPELLASLARQTQNPDITLAIDDHSTDNTRELLHERGFTVQSATSNATDITTRIAQNFVQGVNTAHEMGAEFVVLGDHDDLWHPHRIAYQVKQLQEHPEVSFIASNGRTPTGTLRSTFPVPADFNQLTTTDQWRYVAKHSIATGGASAIAPQRLSTTEVPTGWLHDRWWSLRAVREGSMWVDSEIVIDYRVSPNQEVGLDTAGQGSRINWLWRKVTNLPSTIRKMKDIAQLLGETKAN
jgi:glycosyltransferase involved in cell wall biosynthesis